MKRRPMSRSGSKKHFRKFSKVHPANTTTYVMRGGIRK